MIGRPPTKPRPMIGKEYGRLTVIGEPEKKILKNKWLCECRCGRRKEVTGNNLVSGRSTSCGTCHKLEPDNRLGMIPSLYDRLSGAARAAIKRCTDKTHPRYDDWGGRGISVYQPWVDDYVDFVKYLATLEGCSDGILVLDRTDNDGNYEPGNLRFVTRSESRLNTRPRKVRVAGDKI
jgi:hypothetical protein